MASSTTAAAATTRMTTPNENNNNHGQNGMITTTMDEDDWKDDDFLSLENNASEGERDDMMDMSSSDAENSPTNNNNSNSNRQQQQQQQRPPPWMDDRMMALSGVRTGGGSGYQQQQQQPMQMHPLTLLHNEIVGFCRLMEPTPDEIRKREQLVEKVTRLAEKTFPLDDDDDDNASGARGKGRDGAKRQQHQQPQVQVFGSQATGLFLPTSDIDIVIRSGMPIEEPKPPRQQQQQKDADSETKKSKKNKKNTNKKGGNNNASAEQGEGDEPDAVEEEVVVEEEEDREEDWEKHFLLGGGAAVAAGGGGSGSSTAMSMNLHRFATALREDPEWKGELSYLEVIENTKVPLVKFTHGPTGISCDACFDTFNGVPAAALMKTYMEALPPLRPLTFVIKYFLKARALNEPYSGGVGSFMLQLMIISFLQHHERDAVNYRRPSIQNLGSLLLEFFELYGVEFNYVTTGVSIRHDGFFFPKGSTSRKDVFFNADQPFMCALENPLDTAMDVGKSSFRIQMVQRAFAMAYRMLLAHIAEPVQVPPNYTQSILATILQPTEEMYSRKIEKKRLRPLSSKRSGAGSDDPRTRKRHKS